MYFLSLGNKTVNINIDNKEKAFHYLGIQIKRVITETPTIRGYTGAGVNSCMPAKKEKYFYLIGDSSHDSQSSVIGKHLPCVAKT